MAFNSQSISQQSGIGLPHPQVLSLAKFSFATCSTDLSIPINWTHLPDRDDLNAVFDNIRMQTSSNHIEETSVLKVVKGSEIMEKLDLNSLAQEAKAAEELLATDNNSLAQSAVLIIVRSPCIAIRYPMPTRQTRRFQMRFKTDPEYYKALTVLSELGFPLKQAAAPSTGTRPTSSMTIRPISSASVATTKLKESESQTDYNIRNIPAPTKIAVVASTKPTSSSSSSTIASAIVPNYAPRALLPSPFVDPMPSSALRSPTNGYFQVHSTIGTSTPANQSLEHFLRAETAPRPSTAPAESQSISQWMPPRRELPFPKPPPLVPKLSKPSPPAEKQALSVKKQPSRARKQTKETYQVPTVEELLKMPTTGPSAPMGLRSTVATSKANTSDSRETMSNEASTSATLARSDRSTSRKRPLAGQPDLPNKRSSSLNNQSIASYHQGIAPAQARLHERSNVNPVEPDGQLHGPHNDSTVRLDPWGDPEMDLSAFVAQHPAGRQHEIEDWICRQLADPNFKILCEEVEVCWRTAFLGESQS